MRKFKIWITSICCVIVGFCAICLCGCSDIFTDELYTDENSDTYTKSAYTIAVENGFVGTQTDWLESLKGKSAYEIAVENGFVGDETAWLNSLKSKISVTSASDDREIINKALLSSACIFCSQTENSYSASAGSGVFYKLNKTTGEAYLITNFHVVYDETNKKIYPTIKILPYGYSSDISADYIGGSSVYDIAIIKVTSQAFINSDICAVECLDSYDIEVGQTAIAIGNANGEGASVTKGIVCVDSEYITLSTSDTGEYVSTRVMRIDTAVNKGNSGGGLFNNKGELIGIVNAKIISSDVESIGYAIPASVATKVAENIIYSQANYENINKVRKPMIGITIEVESSSSVYNVETKSTEIKEKIKINKIEETSKIKNNLQPDDIITSISKNDESSVSITRMYRLIDFFLTCKVNDVITITVDRGGQTLSYTFTITEDQIILT